MSEEEIKQSLSKYIRPAESTYFSSKSDGKQHPTGFEPGVAYNGGKGEGVITGKTVDALHPPDWEQMFTENGFSPEEFLIDNDTIEVRTWDMNIGNGEVKRFWYYKAKFVRRAGRIQVDLEEVLRSIKKAKPKATRPAGDQTFTIFCSDWQAGKRDGEGIVGLAKRVEQGWIDAEDRIKALRKGGVEIGTGMLVGMGDLIEGCDGHYDMQTFQVELDRRQQRNFVRRSLAEGIKRLAPLFDQFLVVGVGGNHGENRKGGKAYTNFGDNDDVAVFDELFDAFKEVEAFSHVKFIIPDDDLAVSLNISGQNVTFIHGHQCKGGGKPIEKLWKWWMEQMRGLRSANESRILVAGHFHQFAAHTQGERTVLICPTLDGGSDWFAETMGQESIPSFLTVTFGSGPYGWDNLRVM